MINTNLLFIFETFQIFLTNLDMKQLFNIKYTFFSYLYVRMMMRLSINCGISEMTHQTDYVTFTHLHLLIIANISNVVRVKNNLNCKLYS